jgi:hypothetical protein
MSQIVNEPTELLKNKQKNKKQNRRHTKKKMPEKSQDEIIHRNTEQMN